MSVILSCDHPRKGKTVRSTQPLIVVADSTAESGRSPLVDQLERRYGADYTIVAVPDAAAAAEVLGEAVTQGDRVALLLADNRASHGALGDNRTVFSEARRLFPESRRGLLIPWGAWAARATADTVLELMATNQIDYYVVAPRHSPDERFHRTVTDFLHEWERAVGGRGSDVLVIGSSAHPRTHEVRRFLARGGVPVAAVEPDSPQARNVVDQADVPAGSDPSAGVRVLLPDGHLLTEPSNEQLAHTLGLTTDVPDGTTLDLAIIGAGPAGLASAVYAASEGLRVMVFERDSVGGQAGSSSLIRNYLGFSRGISGAELAERAYQQAWAFGASFAHTREVNAMELRDGGFVLRVAPDSEVFARSVVLATGVTYRRLAIAGLDPYVGSAVFYGVSAVEAAAQRGHTVHIIGGGNSAGQAALQLSRYARSVALVVRSPDLADSMSRYLIDQLRAAGVTIITEAKVVGGGGQGARLDHLVIQNRTTKVDVTVPSDALFVTIGATPHTQWLAPEILRDQWGYVLTGSSILEEGGRRAWPHERPPGPLESSVPGFFAVGDVRRASVKRVASAVGEGSVVVSSVHSFLAG